MHHAFAGVGPAGGVNAWMAYDWVYPKVCGESLIAVDWGNEYKLTKAYHLFRQWAEQLTPGMRLVDVSIAGQGDDATEGKPGVKVNAFVSADRKTLVIHLLNSNDKPALVSLRTTGPFTSVKTAARKRTSTDEDAAESAELKGRAGAFNDTLPARSLTTWRLGR